MLLAIDASTNWASLALLRDGAPRRDPPVGDWAAA